MAFRKRQTDEVLFFYPVAGALNTAGCKINELDRFVKFYVGSLNCSFIHSTQVLAHIFGGSVDSYFRKVVVYCCAEKEVCRHAKRALSRQDQSVRANRVLHGMDAKNRPDLL